MKFLVTLVLVALLVVVGIEVAVFFGREQRAHNEYREAEAQLNQAKIDQGKLQEELRYFAEKANIEKELRARFNYRLPGEKMIILVPSTTTTSTSE